MLYGKRKAGSNKTIKFAEVDIRTPVTVIKIKKVSSKIHRYQYQKIFLSIIINLCSITDLLFYYNNFTSLINLN